MPEQDTEQDTPTTWDNAWREGHAHGLMNALGIPYHDAYQRTAAMLRGEKLSTVPRLLYPGEQCPRCGTIALYPGDGTQDSDTPGLACENAFSDWMGNTYLPEDENAHAVAHEAYCASGEAASAQAAASERRRIAGAIRRNMTHTPLSNWATGWRDCAAWIEQDMPGAGLPAMPAGTDARDSDIQPDPYIDTIAAQHGQEFEPDDQDGDHG